MKKKRNSFIVLFVLLCILALGGVSAQAAEKLAKSDDWGETACDFLISVGALDSQYSYNGTAEVTRAEFLKLTFDASQDALACSESTETIFADVASGNLYKKYVDTAYAKGIISESEDGFNPDSSITLVQALKIVTSTLGYSSYAQVMGGYPQGYIEAANRAQLIDGIKISYDDVLTQSDTMKLLYNTVSADLMQLEYNGAAPTMVSRKDESILTERYDIYSAKGIVEADAYTALIAQDSGLNMDEIRIADAVYKTGESNAEQLLGYETKIWYEDKRDSSTPVIKYTEQTQNNYELKCNPRDLDYVNNFITFTQDGKNKRINLEKVFTTIVNGKMKPMTEEEICSIETGSVTFISNNGDSSIDVILVTSYETLIVSGVSVYDNTIVGRNGMFVELEQDDNMDLFELTKDGNPIAIDSVNVDDVILVAATEGNGRNIKRLYVSSEKFEGTVSLINDEEAVINDDKYYVSKAAAEMMQIGGKHTFLLDSLGNIAYVYIDKDIVLGYLYKIYVDESGENVYCKIFTENSRFVDLQMNSRAKLNGSKLDCTVIYKVLAGREELIRYTVDTDGKIIEINTAEKISQGSAAEKQAIDKDIFRLNFEGKKTWRTTPQNFDGEFFIDKNTKIFVIPLEDTRDNYSIVSSTSLSNDTGYNILAYNIGENMSAEAVVIHDNIDNDISQNDSFMIVKSLDYAMDGDGAVLPSIRGFQKGAEVIMPVLIGDNNVSEDVYNSLKPGSVIQIKFNNLGNISALRLHELNDDGYYLYNALYNLNTEIAGYVEYNNSSLKRIKLRYENGVCGIAVNNAVNVYLYDKSSKTCRTVTQSEILEGDHVIIRMSYLRANEIIIMRD